MHFAEHSKQCLCLLSHPVVEGMLGSRKPTKVAAVGLSGRQHSRGGKEPGNEPVGEQAKECCPNVECSRTEASWRGSVG